MSVAAHGPAFPAAGSWGSNKRWNHWCVTAPRGVLILTVADLDYAGLAAISFLDREAGRWLDRLRLNPLGWRPRLPDSVSPSHIRVERLGLRIDLDDDGESIHLAASARGIAVDLAARRPPGHGILDVTVPFSPGRRHFTSKQQALPARGEVRAGGRCFVFEDGAFACLDFGRGNWPSRVVWNWASASGVQAGRAVGINLGGKWTDGTGVNENGVCVDGRLQRLADVEFSYHTRGHRRPWSIRGPEVDLTLTPRHEKKIAVGLLTLCAEFGTFDGRIAGVEVRDLFGWAEEFRALW